MYLTLIRLLRQLWQQVCQIEFSGYVPFRSEGAVFEPKMAFLGQNLILLLMNIFRGIKYEKVLSQKVAFLTTQLLIPIVMGILKGGKFTYILGPSALLFWHEFDVNIFYG